MPCLIHTGHAECLDKGSMVIGMNVVLCRCFWKSHGRSIRSTFDGDEESVKVGFKSVADVIVASVQVEMCVFAIGFDEIMDEFLVCGSQGEQR